MPKKRRRFTSKFKLEVILESLKERQSLGELAQKYELHQNQISKWKATFLEQAAEYMKHPPKSSKDKEAAEKEQLYAKIGQLQMEVDFLKKSYAKG